MTKTLTKHGNSLALVIDKPFLDLLNITSETPLSITTDGKSLIVSAVDPKRRKKLEAVMDDTFKKYPKMLKRLAE